MNILSQYSSAMMLRYLPAQISSVLLLHHPYGKLTQLNIELAKQKNESAMEIVPLIFLMWLNQRLCWDMEGAAWGSAVRQGWAFWGQCQLAGVYTNCAFMVSKENFKRMVSQLEGASFHKTVWFFCRTTLRVA